MTLNGDRILKTAKALHIVGASMFLGSILTHITVGAIPGMYKTAGATVLGRSAIELATEFVTLPGLALLLLTGVFMTVRGRFGLGKIRWLTVHQSLGVLVILSAVFVLYPVGGELLEAAQAWAQSGVAGEFAGLKTREAAFGAVNIVLALAAIFLAVIKPRWGQGKNR